MTMFPKQHLQFTQPSAMKRQYELKCDDAHIGLLIFPGTFSTLAEATVGTLTWSFKRSGFFRPYVSVRLTGSDEDIAVFHNKTWSFGGTLSLPDGTVLKAETNFWNTQFRILGTLNQPLLTYTISGIVHLNIAIEVHDDAKALAILPWLAMFGCYLVVMMQEDEAAIAAAT
jgi:hypothetical protein